MTPTIRDSMVASIRRELAGRHDRWIRVDCPIQYPVAAALASVGDLERIGILTPFRAELFANSAPLVSDDPSEVTRWRNTGLGPSTVIIGAARGPEEAGLRDTTSIVAVDILVEWRRELLEFARAAAVPDRIETLIDRLVEDAIEERAEATAVEEYVQKVFEDPTTMIAAAGAELWRLGLLADSQLLGTAHFESRLALNRKTVDLLAFGADGPGEERQVARLENSHSDVAARARRYRDTLDPAVLGTIELDDLQAILAPGPPPTPIRRNGLLDYLDIDPTATPGDVVTAIVAALDQLEPLVRDDGRSIAAGVAVDVVGGELSLEIDARSDSPWAVVVGDLSDEDASLSTVDKTDQVVFRLYDGEAPRDGNERVAFSGTNLISIAKSQDEIDGQPRYLPLVEQYLEARLTVARLVSVLSTDDESVFEYLAIKTNVREAAKAYCDAWLALLDAAATATDPPRVLAPHLPLLDGQWGAIEYDPDGSFVPSWGRLAPFHPWRLGPLVPLAEHARTSVGSPRLGGQVRWALDRVTPAYSTTWTSARPLSLSQYSDGTALYTVDPGRMLPKVTNGAGLLQLVESFLRFHPYARDGLSLTLVNPPGGRGIGAALTRLSDRVANFDARVVTTTGDTADLDNTDARFVGRFPSLRGWIEAGPEPSHILVIFMETQPGEGARQISSGPMRGNHVALRLRPVPGPMGSNTLRAQVSVVPRDDNRLVSVPLQLARATGGDDSFMNTNASLPISEIVTLQAASAFAEWVAIGVPGPLGTMSQGDLGDDRLLIGRQDLGSYGLYVFAPGAYAIRRFLAGWIKNLPVTFDESQFDAQIASIATRNPRQLLALSRSKEGATEAFGALIAVGVDGELRPVSDDDYETFYVPMDEIGWTQHWLTERYRADLLRVDIARRDGLQPRIRVRGIEAKGRTTAAPGLSLQASPWDEAAEQVRATLDSIAGLYDLNAPDLFADLRFTAFCEHLFSIAVSRLAPLLPQHIAILANLSALSARDLAPGLLEFDGLAAATFFGSLEPTTARSEQTPGDQAWPLVITRSSGAALTALLTGSGFGPIAVTQATSPTAASDTGRRSALESGTQVADEDGIGPLHGREDEDTNGGGSSPTPAPSGPADGPGGGLAAGGGVPNGRPLGDGTSETPTSGQPGVDAIRPPHTVVDLAERLYAACSRRGFRVGRPDAGTIAAGPTLVSISLPLAGGRTIREIETAAEDLAREVGVVSLQVENDVERPFFVRFLVVRPDRQFPGLPANAASSVSYEDQAYLGLFLGQTVEGRDQVVYASSWPHALIGGTTGSGKTTLLRSIVRQVGSRPSAHGRVIVVDGKGESDYLGLVPETAFEPTFAGPQVEPDSAIGVVRWVLSEELPRRRSIIRDEALRTGNRFDAREHFIEAVRSGEVPRFSPLLVIIDEFGDLMLRGQHRAEFEAAVQSIGATGRSSMVHLVLATQRPERQVVPGIIKGNLPCRIALSLPTSGDSVTILGHGGAEKLTGRGDLIYEPPEGGALRLQGYRV